MKISNSSEVLRTGKRVLEFGAGVIVTLAAVGLWSTARHKQEEKSALVGAWRTFDARGISSTLTIGSDGTYAQALDSKAPKWKAEGNVLVLSPEQNHESAYKYRLSSNERDLTVNMNDRSVVFHRIDQ